MIRVNRIGFDINLNVGLGVQEGMDDLSYELVFCPIMEHVMSYFRNVKFTECDIKTRIRAKFDGLFK